MHFSLKVCILFSKQVIFLHLSNSNICFVQSCNSRKICLHSIFFAVVMTFEVTSLLASVTFNWNILSLTVWGQGFYSFFQCFQFTSTFFIILSEVTFLCKSTLKPRLPVAHSTCYNRYIHSGYCNFRHHHPVLFFIAVWNMPLSLCSQIELYRCIALQLISPPNHTLFNNNYNIIKFFKTACNKTGPDFTLGKLSLRNSISNSMLSLITCYEGNRAMSSVFYPKNRIKSLVKPNNLKKNHLSVATLMYIWRRLLGLA